MRIGELASRVGVSTDTVRFYERSGWLPRASRRDNRYREYGDADVEHLRLLIDLRRLDIPLEDAARVASWCHSGHCADTSGLLPRLIADRRVEIAERIAGLVALDMRLAGLERHVSSPRTLRSSAALAHAARPRMPWSAPQRVPARAAARRKRDLVGVWWWLRISRHETSLAG